MKNTRMISILLGGTFACTSLNAQEGNAGPDPFVKGERTASELVRINPSTSMMVRHEEFSLDLATAAGLIRKGLGDAALYEVLLEMVANNSAKQESLSLLRVISENQATSESVAGYIYPTEYEPAELPNTVGVSIVPPRPSASNSDGSRPSAPALVPDTEKLSEAADLRTFQGLATPATGSAFDTQKTGRTIELDASVDDSGAIAVIISLEHTVFVGSLKFGQGVSELTMPEFETRGLRTKLDLTPGAPALAGMVNRTPESKLDADAANRTWFAFITADFVKP